MATKLASQVESLRTAHAQARALLALGQRLSTSTDAEGIRRVGAAALAHVMRCEVAVLARDASQVLRVVASSPRDFDLTSQDLGAAEWSEKHSEQAGRFTDTLNAAPCWVLPLGSDDNHLGVAALRLPAGQGEPSTDERSLALTMVQDIGHPSRHQAERGRTA